MEISDLLVSYKQVHAPHNIPTTFNFPRFDRPEVYLTSHSVSTNTDQKIIQKPEQTPAQITQKTIYKQQVPTVKGSSEFERAYDEVEKTNPDAKKYRKFLTLIAQKESNFDPYIQNKAGAPAYGYFQFMQDDKKYNNISTYAGTDIETFRNNPKLQIEAAIKLAKEFERGFTKKDKELAKQKGFTTFGLLGGAWLGGVKGVRKVLQGSGNPSDKHWGGVGTTVADRIRQFNFKKGGTIKNII